MDNIAQFAKPIQPISPELKQQAEHFHAQGYASRKRGDYKQAIALYSQALAILPSHFKALFNRGFAYDKLGQFDLAIKDYSTAI
jgi:tetratricopeptide (TPR) repeat protein